MLEAKEGIRVNIYKGIANEGAGSCIEEADRYDEKRGICQIINKIISRQKRVTSTTKALTGDLIIIIT